MYIYRDGTFQFPLTSQIFILTIYSFRVFQVEQIQAEYKVLALQHHPDKNNGDKEAEAKFQNLKVNTDCYIYMCVCVFIY